MGPILVTGGAGFIGSAFVRRWVQQAHGRIINLDKLTYAGNIESLGPALHDPQHRLVVGDVCDSRMLAQLFSDEHPRAIVHFAAESHVDRSIDGPGAFVTTNVVGTFQMLQSSLEYWRSLPQEERAAFRFLHVSTDEVFGSARPGATFRETSPYAPNSPYAASKAAADHLARAYFQTYGLPTIISHSSNNYGPYQFPEKLIPHIVVNARSRRPLPLYGDGKHERDWVHVEDHCRALEMILQHGSPGEVYLVGTGETQTNRNVTEAICALVDELCPGLPHRPARGLLQAVPDRPGHDRRYCVDSSKLRKALGWAPSRSFAVGLRETVAWYLSNGEWVDRVISGKYRWERLGLERIDLDRTGQRAG